jgi:hypothetical protein
MIILWKHCTANICLSLFPSPCFVQFAVHLLWWFFSSMQTLFTESLFLYSFTQFSKSFLQKFQLLRYFKTLVTHTAATITVPPIQCIVVEFAMCFENNCNNTYRIWCYSSVWVLASSSPARNDKNEKLQVTHTSEYYTCGIWENMFLSNSRLTHTK